MHKVYIKGMGYVPYVTKDVINSLPEDDIHVQLFKYIAKLAMILRIPVPDLSLISSITTYNPGDGSMSDVSAILCTTSDLPYLNNSLLIMTIECMDDLEYFSGVLAHEMRHLWQELYNPKIREKKACGFLESLYNEAEVDADGFAIAFISFSPNFNLENAGKVICKKEYEEYNDAFLYRIEAAKQIKEELYLRYEEIKKERARNNSFWKKLLSKFRKREKQ